MSNNEHPITPPPELVEQWYDAIDNSSTSWKQELATQAARWGYEQRGAVNETELQQARDEELEACCKVLATERCEFAVARYLRTARRPKPKSLKEQALKVLFEADGPDHPVPMLVLRPEDAAVIRRALEALPGD